MTSDHQWTVKVINGQPAWCSLQQVALASTLAFWEFFESSLQSIKYSVLPWSHPLPLSVGKCKVLYGPGRPGSQCQDDHVVLGWLSPKDQILLLLTEHCFVLLSKTFILLWNIYILIDKLVKAPAPANLWACLGVCPASTIHQYYINTVCFEQEPEPEQSLYLVI